MSSHYGTAKEAGWQVGDKQRDKETRNGAKVGRLCTRQGPPIRLASEQCLSEESEQLVAPIFRPRVPICATHSCPAGAHRQSIRLDNGSRMKHAASARDSKAENDLSHAQSRSASAASQTVGGTDAKEAAMTPHALPTNKKEFTSPVITESIGRTEVADSPSHRCAPFSSALPPTPEKTRQGNRAGQRATQTVRTDSVPVHHLRSYSGENFFPSSVPSLASFLLTHVSPT
ncbi:hypothetical protein ERJ75_000583000 [Trypanosoma vivax]|nr:hypothetical protein ERJ75_000583000 [Trypanosoma vivax]